MTTAVVLLAFDGSPPARTALERAAEVFGGAEAIVAPVAPGVGNLEDAAGSARVVLPDDVIRTAARRLTDAALADAEKLAEEGARLARDAGFASAQPLPVPAEASVAAALLDAAREAGADAIVCGKHGHGMVVRAILGSVASRLAREAEIPVLVVHREARPAAGPIVIGYDGSEASLRAIAACGRLLGGREAVVAYVWRSRVRHTIAGAAMRHAPLEEVRGAITDLDAMFEQWAEEDAGTGAEIAGEHGLEARGRAIESAGPPSAALLDLADEVDAAAIVVGRRGHGALAAAVLGSVSASLVHASERPVLVV